MKLMKINSLNTGKKGQNAIKNKIVTKIKKVKINLSRFEENYKMILKDFFILKHLIIFNAQN